MEAGQKTGETPPHMDGGQFLNESNEVKPLEKTANLIPDCTKDGLSFESEIHSSDIMDGMGDKWYDNPIIMWVICSLIPLLLLITYPLIVLSWYTIVHVILAMIMVQISIYRYYKINVDRLDPLSSQADKSTTTTTRTMQKQIIELHNPMKSFLLVVIVLQMINLTSKCIFIIVYYACGRFSTHQEILLDFEFFFVKDGTTTSETSNILLTFLPNTLLLVIFWLAFRIGSDRRDIKLSKLLNINQQTARGILNFLVLVGLVGCQVFNPSITAFGFLGFFLISQLNFIIFKDASQVIRQILYIQFSIQVYCALQFIMLFLQATSTYEKYQPLDSDFLGFSAVSNFSQKLSKYPFYLLCLCLLFVISVVYSQTLNFEIQREISIGIYKEIVGDKRDLKFTLRIKQFLMGIKGDATEQQEVSVKNKIRQQAYSEGSIGQIEIQLSQMNVLDTGRESLDIQLINPQKKANKLQTDIQQPSNFIDDKLKPKIVSFSEELPQNSIRIKYSTVPSKSNVNVNDLPTQVPDKDEKMKLKRKRTEKYSSLSGRSAKLLRHIKLFGKIIKKYFMGLSISSFSYLKKEFGDSMIPIRILQCCSIIAIMRYPCYYSLGLIFWVTANSHFKHGIWLKSIFIILVPIPCLILVYSFTLYGSIEHNQYHPTKHGFIFQEFFWLECIILNLFIFLFFGYLLILRNLSQQIDTGSQTQEETTVSIQQEGGEDNLKCQGMKLPEKSENGIITQKNFNMNDTIGYRASTQIPQGGGIFRRPSRTELMQDIFPQRFVNAEVRSSFSDMEGIQLSRDKVFSNFSKKEGKNSRQPDLIQPVPLQVIFLAIILKSSQPLALFLLYWIGFYTFNMMHLLLVLFFLIFFQNREKTINIKQQGKIYEMSFSFKYWIFLLTYLSIIIFTRFIFHLIYSNISLTGELSITDKDVPSIYYFIGINYDYNVPFSWSLSRGDFASLSIIWFAFMCATIQEDTYRSETYQKYSNHIPELIQALPFWKKYFPKVLKTTNKLVIVLKNGLLWCSFFAITSLLLMGNFSFFKCILLFAAFSLIIYFVHFFHDARTFNYEKLLSSFRYYKGWYVFNLVMIAYIIVCYIFQFTALNFVKEYIVTKESLSYKTFNRNREVYGIYRELEIDESLRIKFLPVILELYFAIQVQNYLKKISDAVKYHTKEQIKSVDPQKNISEPFQQNVTDIISEISEFPQVQTKDAQFEVINKNFLLMRKLRNLQIYHDFILLDLLSEMKGVDSFLKTLQLVTIDIQNSLVFLFAMVFRLSISMLIYIIIYLRFYYNYHQEIEGFLEEKQVNKSMQSLLKSFSEFFSFSQTGLGWLRESKNDEHQTKEVRLTTQELLEKDIDMKLVDFVTIQQKLKIKWGLTIWKYSFWFSLICITLTYASRFFAEDMATFIFGEDTSLTIQWALFIFGTSGKSPEFAKVIRSTYFYVLMFWINIFIAVLLRLLRQHEIQESYRAKNISSSIRNKQTSKYSINRISFGRDKQESNEGTLSGEFDENDMLSEDSNESDPSSDINIFEEQIILRASEGEHEVNIVLFEEAKLTQCSLLKDHFKIEVDSEKIIKNDTEIAQTQTQKRNFGLEAVNFDGDQCEFGKKLIDLKKDNATELESDSKECDFVYNNYLRIQYFYEMKMIYMREMCKSALLKALFPFYTVILMRVSYEKHDVFSYIYLVIAFQGNSLKAINRNTVFLVLLQYVLRLLNINEETSPLEIDPKILKLRQMSFIQQYITSPEILSYLAFSSQGNSALISFLLNAMVFFIVGQYFNCFKYIISSITRSINGIKNRMRSIYEHSTFPKQILESFNIKNPEDIFLIKPVWINYKAWRNSWFKVADLSFELIITFGYIGCVVLIMIISSQQLDIFNFFILLYMLIVFIITELIVPFPLMLNQQSQIRLIFLILQIYIFIVFALFCTVQIPYVKDILSQSDNFFSHQLLQNDVSDKITITFFILCVQQLLNSSSFKFISNSVSQSYTLNASLSYKALSIKNNDAALTKLLQNEKERRHLHSIVQRVTQTLRNWHHNQFDQNSPQTTSQPNLLDDNNIFMNQPHSHKNNLSPSINFNINTSNYWIKQTQQSSKNSKPPNNETKINPKEERKDHSDIIDHVSIPMPCSQNQRTQSNKNEHMDRNPNGDANRDLNGDVNMDRNVDTDRDRNGDVDRDRDRDGNGDEDRDRDGDGDEDRDQNGHDDRDRNGQEDRDRNGQEYRDRNGQEDKDRNGQEYRDRNGQEDRDRNGQEDRDRNGDDDRDRNGHGDSISISVEGKKKTKKKGITQSQKKSLKEKQQYNRDEINTLSTNTEYENNNNGADTNYNNNGINQFIPQGLISVLNFKQIPFQKILTQIYMTLITKYNPLYFMESIARAEFIVENNRSIFNRIYVNIDDLLLNDFNSIIEYTHLLSIVYSSIYQVVSESGMDFALNNIFSIIKKSTQCDATSRAIYNNLIQTPHMFSTIPYYYHLRSIQNQSITDRHIQQQEQDNNINYICIYHPSVPIYLFNVKSTSRVNFYLKFGIIFKIAQNLGKVVISHLQYVCYGFFIMYFFSNPGVMSLPFLALVFLNFMIERKLVMLIIWVISFFYVSILILSKYIIQINGIYLSDELKKEFFYDNFSMNYEGFLIFLIFVAQLVCKQVGVDKEDIYHSENVHQSYIRRVLNDQEFSKDFIESQSRKNDSGELIHQVTNRKVLEPNSLEESNQDVTPILISDDIQSKQYLEEVGQQLIKQRTSMEETDKQNLAYQQWHTRKEKSQNMHEQILKEIRIKPSLLLNQSLKKDNFFQRVFSIQNKRAGQDFYPWIVLVQMITLMFIFGFYTQLNTQSKQDINQQLKYNQFSGEMVICLLIQVAFIIFERILALRHGEEFIETTQKSKNSKLEGLNSSFSSSSDSSCSDSSPLLSSNSSFDEELDDNCAQSSDDNLQRETMKNRIQYSEPTNFQKNLYEEDNQNIRSNNSYQMEASNSIIDVISRENETSIIKQVADSQDLKSNAWDSSSKGMKKRQFIDETQGMKKTQFIDDTQGMKNSQFIDEKQVIRSLKQKKIDYLLRDSLLFANIQRDSINVNLEKYKRFSYKCSNKEVLQLSSPNEEKKYNKYNENKQRILFSNQILPDKSQNGIDLNTKIDEENNTKNDNCNNQMQDPSMKVLQLDNSVFKLTTESLKYIQMCIFVPLLSWFIYFFIPRSVQYDKTNVGMTTIGYEINGYLFFFYFLICMYMLLSALQIRYGYKKLKQRNTLLQSKSQLAGFAALTMKAIPFLQELKVMLDWTVTSTSLTLFQWFLLEEIHFSLFVAKQDSQDTQKMRVDQPISKVLKFFMGFFAVLGILLLLFGPMLLFSNLNPISEYNMITGGGLELGIEFISNNNANYYTLFSNSHASNLQVVPRKCSQDQTSPISSNSQNCYWNKYEFFNVKQIADSDPQLFQKFDLYSYSERVWDISLPSRNDLISKFQDIIVNHGSLSAKMIMKLQINRQVRSLFGFIHIVTSFYSVPYQTTYPNDLTSQPPDNNTQYLSIDKIKELSNLLNNCNSKPVKLPQFYLFVSDFFNNFELELQIYPNHEYGFVEENLIQCFDKERYWKLSLDPEMTQGLTFFTLSDKYSTTNFGFSIITLYTSVILVIGKFIRDALSGEQQQIILKCMPNPDELLRLCEAISNARNERDLLQICSLHCYYFICREKLLFFELLDLTRSPEFLKKLTNSFSAVLTQKHKLEVEQSEREKANRKKQRTSKKLKTKKVQNPLQQVR